MKKQKIKLFNCLLVIFVFIGVIFSPIKNNIYAANTPAIQLTYGTDGNGQITEWMLKGDANRDGKVSNDPTIGDDSELIDKIWMNQVVVDNLAMLSADVNNSGNVSGSDTAILDSLFSGAIPLPSNDFFHFSVTDKPNAGYKVKEATITANGNAITLTPNNPTSAYTLVINADGSAIVKGQSLAVNDVKFTHEAITITNPSITLTHGTDSNGQITEWMLKGDANRDGKVSNDPAVGDDLMAINNLWGASSATIDPLVIESADLDNNQVINNMDSSFMNGFFSGAYPLPDYQFTFRVISKPNTGYQIKQAVITADGNVITLTPDNPMDGNYNLLINVDGSALVIGRCLAVNDVQFTHEVIPTTPAIKLTYDTDSNGQVTDWMLKGDVNGNQQVTLDDSIELQKFINGEISISDPRKLENADADNNSRISSSDVRAVESLVNGIYILPKADYFTFRVVDKPINGYRVSEITINGQSLNVPVIGWEVATVIDGITYKVKSDWDGTTTVIGASLALNDIQFKHVENTPAISLIYGSDSNGNITDWRLKGDADGDNKITDKDMKLAWEVANFNTTITDPKLFDNIDFDGNTVIDSYDLSKMHEVLNNAILPLSKFSFLVVDTPNPRYYIYNITVNNQSLLIPEKGSSTNTTLNGVTYTVTVEIDGKATVTGESLATNNVQFIHSLITENKILPKVDEQGNPIKSITTGNVITQINDITSEPFTITDGADTYIITKDIDGNYIVTLPLGNSNKVYADYYAPVSVEYKFVSTNNPSNIVLPSKVTLIYGSTISQPKFTSLDNWTFDGWYTDKACTQQFDFTKAITANNILYGKWINKKPVSPIPPIPEKPSKPSEPILPIIPVAPTTPPIQIIPNTPENTLESTEQTEPKEKDIAAAISKDIPLSKIKNGITNDLIKSYITATTQNRGVVKFEIVTQNVESKAGEYTATIRLDDGTELTVKLKVVDDTPTEVVQPEYGRDEECITHWILFLMAVGYSVYALILILKRRKDNKELENTLNNNTNTKGEE